MCSSSNADGSQLPSAIDCTIGILTFNSATTLARTLSATQDFRERIICDGGSTDGTIELARAHGCKVLMQAEQFKRSDNTLRNFAGAMRQLLTASTMPWFFKVDSDEVPSVELVNELRIELSENDDVDGYTVPLKYVVNGRVIEAASTYPMHHLHVIRVASGLTFSGAVHERVETSDQKIKELQQPLYLPQASIRELVPRWWRYLGIEVDAARVSPLHLRWRNHARHHMQLAKFLAWRYTKVLRSGSRPRLPLRFEVLRVANHLVAVVVLLTAPRHRASGGHLSADLDEASSGDPRRERNRSLPLPAAPARTPGGDPFFPGKSWP